jgi:two-component system, OmpR family, phosphate regulon sensor histidine kinase PhoR
MKLSRNAIWILVTAATVSLAGLVWVQVQLLRNALKVQKQSFRQNAQAALTSAVEQMENREVARGIFDVSVSRPHVIMSATINGTDNRVHGDSLHDKDSMVIIATTDTLAPFWFSQDTLIYSVPADRRVVLRRSGNGGGNKLLIDSVMPAGIYHLPLDHQQAPTHAFMYSYLCDDDSLVMELSHSESAQPIVNAVSTAGKQKIVRKVLDKLVTAEFLPVERRIDTTQLDSILTAAFVNHGIQLGSQWGVLNLKRDSLSLKSEGVDDQTLRNAWLRTRLFPQDVFAPHADLLVHFPDEESFVMAQVVPQFTATGLFMLIVVICFAYTIRTILLQRRFADLTVGFINNMTHEFKTPISTISLACQALERPDVQESIDQSTRYLQMIRSENQRMKDHVDKILQMAVLEENSCELSISQVDMHSLIEKSCTHVVLQIEQTSGAFAFDLRAVNYLVNGDPTHLTNIIVNLLDNAVKYSNEPPSIRIVTWNPPGAEVVCVRVEDKGIGISAHDLPQVFEKYYRVASGDIHNVRGFGIGLSYVKLMIEAHGGHIRIESTPNRGTAVEFTLPVTVESNLRETHAD